MSSPESAEQADTPPSSPPSDGAEQDSSKMNDADVGMSAVQGESTEVSASMKEEEDKMQKMSLKEEKKRQDEFAKQRKKDAEGGKEALDTKFKALDYLLSQSKLYSAIMLQQIQKQEQADVAKDSRQRKREENREARAEQAAQASQRKSTRKAAAATEHQATDSQTATTTAETQSPKRGRGRPAKAEKQGSSGRITDYLKEKALEGKSVNEANVKQALEQEIDEAEGDGVDTGDIGMQNLRSARQPDLVSGGVMRKYQLEGLEWLTSLYENGLNGILADEMGLGKTIQTISFIAFLRERGVNGPFLIAAPLSTTSNWVDEFKKWTPTIPVVLYHGTKLEREDIRKTQLKNPGSDTFPIICTSYEICMNDRKFLAHYGWKFIIIDEGHRIKNLNCRLIRELQSYQSANRLLITGTPLQNNLAELWSLLHFLMPDIFQELESFESWFDFSALKEKGGHEQIFSEEKKKTLITSLHAILKPFLLRRVKADVEHSLPKKREYILYAPLSSEQRELYQQILDGTSRSFLEEKVVETLSRTASGANTPYSTKSKSGATKRKSLSSGVSTPSKSIKTSRASTPATNASAGVRSSRRATTRQDYSELNDRKYFQQLEAQANETSSVADEADSVDEQEDILKQAKKQIAQKKLQNPVMQLRLCCNSPHNFYDPYLDQGDEDELYIRPEDIGTKGAIPSSKMDYQRLLSASGKMVLLDRLLSALLATTKGEEPHKILLFSQFKSQLDILSLYLTYKLRIAHCRIDGSIPQSERAESIRLFNSSAQHRVFLLSTRAGGQGINLAAADTVILFDSDWNPQQDLQAQDRAHRIGQRRNVIVYRLATRGTVEEMLLSKAEGKRRLEKLVIRKGGVFRRWHHEQKKSKGSPAGARKGRGRPGKRDAEDEEDDFVVGSGYGDSETEEEEEEEEGEGELEMLRRLLASADGEEIDAGAGARTGRAGAGTGKMDGRTLLSDADLVLLTDRSEEAYERVQRGEDLGTDAGAFKAVETKNGGDGLVDVLS